MKFFGWLGSLFGRSRLDKGQQSDPFTGTTSASGNAINAETALKLSAVWACVRLRSQVIGSLPLHLYGKDKKTADNHPLYRLLHDSPNADMTASEGKKPQEQMATMPTRQPYARLKARLMVLADELAQVKVKSPRLNAPPAIQIKHWQQLKTSLMHGLIV